MSRGIFHRQLEFFRRAALQLVGELHVEPAVFIDLADKEFLHAAILIIEQDHAPRQLPVAPGAAGLLVILLQRAGQVVVNDEANVRLVDAHAERIRGDRDRAGRVHEAILIGRARRLVHAGVIGKNRPVHQLGREVRGQLVGGFSRRAINDPAALLRSQQLQQQLIIFRHAHRATRFVKQIGPIESGHDDARLAQRKPLNDVGANFFGRGCGERDRRRRPEALPHLAQL